MEFDDLGVLQPAGYSNLRAAEGVLPSLASKTTVRQGYREASNVNTVEELVGLISVTRLYEANLKCIMTQDEQLKQILNVAMS